MRFEVASAFALGVLLPVLETCRRGLAHWNVNVLTMAEDYVAGAVLLFAAWAAHRGRPWGALFLLAVWSAVAAIVSLSFWSQVEYTLRGTIAEPHNGVVIFVKFLLWTISIASLISAFRHAMKRMGER